MKNLLKSFISVIGLSVSFTVLKEEKSFQALFQAIQLNPYLMLFSMVALYHIFKRIDRIKHKTSFLQKIISIFFSLCTWLTEIYSSGIDSMSQVLVQRPVGILYSLFFMFAFYQILESVQKIILELYYQEEWWHIKLTHPVIEKSESGFTNHPFLSSFATISFVWMVIALTTYPGTFMGDTMDQLLMYFGNYDRLADHPVLSTLTMGFFVEIGTRLGNPNLGIFLLTLFQIIFVAASFSFGVTLFVKLTKQSGIGIMMVTLIALIPSVHGTVFVLTKDIIFSGLFIIYISTLVVYFYNQGYFFKNKLWVVHSISIIFMMLYRYNTLHFILPTLFIYFIFYLFHKKQLPIYKTIIAFGLIGLVIGSAVNSVLVNQFAEKQQKPNRREMLSVPFQQTARYIRYHEDEISKEDKEVISKVLDYKKIKENYNPYRSDPVKRTHKEDASGQEMKDYFKLVLKQSIKHPALAFESLAASHSNLFNVNRSMNSYYTSEIFVDEPEEIPDAYKEFAEDRGIEERNSSKQMSRSRLTFYLLWDRLPFFSQINNYGSYIFILFSMFAILLRNRRFKYAAAMIPVLGVLATLIAGPITIGYIRYILPVILAAPILFGFFISSNKMSEQ